MVELLTPEITIAGRRIGSGQPAYIIAEMSANHHGDYDEAVRLVKAAKEAGADAIKLQTYTADTLTIKSDLAHFRIQGNTLWDGRTLYDLYKEAYTPWEWQPRLKRVADQVGLHLFSSPFDTTAVDFLETMQVPVYKIASFEIVDIALLQRVAKTKKPVIVSTGMATLAEIEEAVSTLRHAGATQIALMKCTSAYPANPEDSHLNTMRHLAEAFEVPVGLSDHTMGPHVPIGAAALGMSLLEKHFVMDRKHPGPDSAFSMEPAEFKDMVQGVRTLEKARGSVHYGINAEEEKSRIFRRSLFVVEDIKAGDVFTAKNIRSIRPGYGLHTRFLPQVLGRHAATDLARGTPLAWSHMSGEKERTPTHA